MKRVQQKTERKISAALRLALVALLLLLQIAVVVALSMVLKQKIYIAYAILEIIAVLCVARIYTRPGSSTYKPGWIVLIMLVPVVERQPDEEEAGAEDAGHAGGAPGGAGKQRPGAE